MWAFGRYRLHLTDDEFFDLTFAQFSELMDQWKGEQKDLNWRAAQICAVLAEIHRDPKKRNKPYTAKDFMPRKKKALSDEQMMMSAEAIVLSLGGEIK